MTHGINRVWRSLQEKMQFNNFKTTYSFPKKIKGRLYNWPFLSATLCFAP